MQILRPFLGEQQNDNESCFPSLSYKERMIGFAFCFGLGTLIQILSFGALLGILTGSPQKFAITYTLGNIISLLGTSFLIGPKRQFNNMTDKSRLWTSIIFLGSMILTIFSALVLHSALLVLICIIVQFCAFVWYVASYIPYGRDCIRNCLEGTYRRCFNRN